MEQKYLTGSPTAVSQSASRRGRRLSVCETGGGVLTLSVTHTGSVKILVILPQVGNLKLPTGEWESTGTHLSALCNVR